MAVSRAAIDQTAKGPSWPVWGIGLFLVLMLGSKAADIFGGRLPDNDDLLRMQQVRDLIAGQNWFNVDQARLLTPEGGNMHWSRLPDIAIGALIMVFRPFVGQANAEAFAAIVWPLILLVSALGAITVSLRRLGVGPFGQALGLLFFGVSGAIYNFWLGRIDHHGLVVVLVLIGFASLLSPQRSQGSAIMAAGCVTAMISVAIESLPYGAALIGILGLLWIIRGHEESARLAVFGAALCAFAAIFFVLDAPGISARRAVCDAYGQSHLAGLVGGGVMLGLIGVFGSGLSGWTTRLAVGAVAGALTLGLVVLVQPDCLGDPYAEVSDQVKLAWLSAVGEARSLQTLFGADLQKAVWQTGFMLAGLIASGVLVWQAEPGQRAGRAALLLLMTLSLAATVWQVRGVTFSHLFAAMACGGVVGLLAQHWWDKRGAGPALALCLAAFLGSPIGWKQMTAPLPTTTSATAGDKAYKVLCTEPAAYQGLDQFEGLNVFTPIDLGMPVLSRSAHNVFAGPYHRNVQGIDRVTDVFMGPPDTARAKMLAMGADHVLYCQGLNETARYARLRPDGFAAQMESGAVPNWLAPIDGLAETDGVVRLYEIKP